MRLGQELGVKIPGNSKKEQEQQQQQEKRLLSMWHLFKRSVQEDWGRLRN